MAFRGVLHNLSDLLQFLVHAQKTGIMQVYDADDTKFLAFNEGQLNYAVHQRQAPSLADLFYGSHGPPQERDVDDDRWHEVVSRALDEQRHFSLERLQGAQAADYLQQVKTLSNQSQSTIRLGEYLTATGQISQRQFERALEVQLASKKRLGEILVDEQTISEEDLQSAVTELESLRRHFGPLFPLERQLARFVSLESEEFMTAASENVATGRPLWDILVATERVTDDMMRRVVEEVLVDELCDLLLWSDDAYFRFHENFFLDNVNAANGFPTIHRGSFDVQSLLLRAHSRIDDLQRDGLRKISLTTIFVATTTSDENEDRKAITDPQHVLRNLDGQRPLREVRRALPGNRFFHFQLFTEFIDLGLARPLTRPEAFERGNEAQDQGLREEALAFYEHALAVEGDEPSNTRLRAAIQQVRGSSPITSWAPVTNADTDSGQWPASRRDRVKQLVAQTKLASRAVLIRSGWARHFWAFRNRVVEPLARALRVLAKHGHARLLLKASPVALALVLAFWLRDEIREIPVTSATGLATSRNASVLRSWDASYPTEGPIPAAPIVARNQIYVGSRDGTVRALHVAADRRLELRWELPVGEFGDLISQPTVAEGALFVANARGIVMAISERGEIRWQREFPRLEPLPPQPLLREGSGVVGVAVVGRENAYVLSPTDGETLFELSTGNRILAPPIGDGNLLFVGSADNHIYGADWTQDHLYWDHEETDDVVSLAWTDGVLIFATRDGRLAGLEGKSGRKLWGRDFPKGAIGGLDVVAPGRVCLRLEQGATEVVSVASGETLSSFQPDPTLNAEVTTPFTDGFFFIAATGHVGEIGNSGELRWRSRDPVGRVAGQAHGPGFLAVTNHEGEVILFSRGNEAKESGLSP